MKSIYKLTLILVVVSMCLMASANANGQKNIATTSDQVTTSFVSGWEKLSAVNDGIEPLSSTDKQGAAYGNWNGSDNNRWHWVVYSWNKLQQISRSEVYWWTDGGGIQIPTDSYLEYWDFMGKEWVKIPGSQQAGISNQYQVVSFNPVLTNRIRINMTSSIATGILEWKVWGEEGEQVPLNTTVVIDKNIEKGSTSTVILTALDASNVPVPGYVFKLDALVTNETKVTAETYIINNEPVTSTVRSYSLPETNKLGIVSFDIAIPPVIDPKDGIVITPKFNNGTISLNSDFSIAEKGLVPPALLADATQNNVDRSIEISFPDNPEWRKAVKKISVDGSILTEGPGYKLSEGKLTLIPSGLNPALTVSGKKNIAVEAVGYEFASVTQDMLTGAPNSTQSSISVLNTLFRAVSTQIKLIAKDQFGNLVQGVSFKYDVQVINANPKTAETYKVAGVNVTSGLLDATTAATNNLGQIQIPLAISANVDKDDGVSIVFKLSDGTPLAPTISYLFDGTEKTILVQAGVKTQPDFSWERTAQSKNFIIYWGEKVNGDPSDKTANPTTWFNTGEILTWLENIHSYIADSVGFLHKNDGNAAKYKYEVVMNNTWKNNVFTGWAFGGIADGTIGGMWIDAGATRDDGVLSHEFTHVCQGMVALDHPGYGINTPYGGFFWESHANWMRSVYAKDHGGLLDRYINTSMMHYSVTRRHYQNFAFLDYVKDKYGMQTTNDIWHKASAITSHPLTSLRDSVLRYSQDDLNNDLAMCAMKNVTWDYSVQKDIKKVIASLDPSLIGREYTILDSLKSEPGTFIVPEYLAPADYGYNIIPLFADDNVSEIKLNFKGLENEPAGGAGSRYGFVAVNANGAARYSDIYTEQDQTTTFPLQPTDTKIYLVVMGAPKVHHNYPWEAGFPKIYRYPYQVQFSGAIPAGHKPGYNQLKESKPGAPHANGGGWVASTASVASTVYVGPNAQVLKNAVLTGSCRIGDYAIVTDNAKVRENAIIRGHVIVGGTSNISGKSVIERTARVYNTTTKNNVVVTGSALVYNSSLSGDAIAKDLAILWGVTLNGTIIVGGDGEEYTNCSSGTYLEIRRTGSCDGIVNHTYDQEVNPAWPEYVFPSGDKPAASMNLRSSDLTTSSVKLVWDQAPDNDGNLVYYVWKGTEVIATVSELEYLVTGLENTRSYNFYIQAKDPKGNVSEKSNKLLVKPLVTGTDSPIQGDLIKIYPNPVKDMLNIELNENNHATLLIRDLLGRNIIERNFDTSIQINRSEFGPDGVYALILQVGSNRIYKKLVVQ